MADYSRPPQDQSHYNHQMFEFGSSLPPGALVPSIPGYSPVNQPSSPRSNSINDAHRHMYGGGGAGAGAGEFGAYNPGPRPSATLPTPHRGGGSGSSAYSTREHGALPPTPPVPARPHGDSIRRALPKLPGVSEASAPQAFQTPSRPAAPPAQALSSSGPSNQPPMPPPRSMTGRRALPTPPGHPNVPPPAVPVALPNYDSPPQQRTLPNPASYQRSPTTFLPQPPSSHHPQHSPQRGPPQAPSRTTSTGSSYLTSNLADSYFGTSTADHTSLTSLPSQSSQHHKTTYDTLTSGMYPNRSDSPADDAHLAYDGGLDVPGGHRIRTISESSDQNLSSTPRGPSWQGDQQRLYAATSPSINSLQTEAAATPAPFVSTSSIPTPAPVSFPDARHSEAAPAFNFPTAHPSNLGPSSQPPPHRSKDLYADLGVDIPDSLDGHDATQHFSQQHQHEQPVASSSTNNRYLHAQPNGDGSAPGSADVRGGTQWAEQSTRAWVQTKLALHQTNGGGEYYDDEGWNDEYASSGEEDDAEDDMNEFRFFNPAYLSDISVQVRDRVIRGQHVKGGLNRPGTFTGKDLVTAIGSFMPAFTRDGPADRRFALQTAKSLASQLWIIEVDWEDRSLRDSPDDVFKFMSEMEGMEDVSLPKGVLTMATKCYSSSCAGKGGCYAPRCPYNTPPNSFLTVVDDEPGPSRQPVQMVVRNETDWTEEVPAATLAQMSDEERKRQTLIRQAIIMEERYEADLAVIEQTFIIPLQTANPPIVQPYGKLDQYVRTLFSNILEIRRASRALLDNFAIHLREQGPLIQTVGDIFLETATDYRSLYPSYTDNLPRAEALLSQALEENRPFAQWMAEVSKGADRRLDLRYLLKRPAMHLQNYPEIISNILRATSPESPDCDFLREALESIQSISYLSRLKLYQASKGRGQQGQLSYEDIVSPTVLKAMSSKAQKRQFNIWELIKGEMEYVADLEAIDAIFITPLREADRPIIDRSRLEVFIDDAFHNYRSILDVHERLLSELHERQIEQHPNFGMVSDLIFNAALHWHEAYMEYMPHYPIAKAKIDEEKARNPHFAAFLDECYKNPLSNRQDINHYIYRPIARLLRYKLLLSDVLKATIATCPPDHPDIDTIPQVIDLIDNLAKAGEKGVAVNTAKVELWELKSNLDSGKLGPRVVKDLDLLSPMRELIHKGKVFRQPEGTISGSWSELHLLLFDHYFVQVKQTKSKKDSTTRYSINRRPIPLELLSLGDFFQPAQTRSIGVLNKIGGNKAHGEGKEQAQSDSRTVYPFTFSIIGAGLSSGQYTLWTDSEPARREWHEKLKHAKVLRTEVDEAGKVFDFTPLSLETFYMAPGYGAHPHANQEYTGRVTCSVPFVTVDRRNLVAVGCEQGVWIGVQHDPPSLRKVLHVKSVTQISVLEEFGIFLVLADKSLLAYHLEALVPTAQSPQVRSAPQRLSGVRDIVFFVVGQISGRTLVLYVKRKGIDSVFRVLEPVLSRGAEDRRRGALGGLLGQRSEWFRLYKEFFIPTEALHVHFLKAKIAIVCAKGFEIMGLTDLRGGSIPIFDQNKARERPALAELARMCENAKPIAMFRSTESEFLLCYDRFGIYVDRHGEPNRDLQPIEWEGTPENIVFHPPYLLLVSPSFIEVRHIDTAKLLQIYTGVDIRCTWDGTGGMAKRPNDAPGPKGWGEEVTSTEPRLHICKRTDDPRRTKGIGQHVFELTPTLLLNNPLLNPVHTQDPNYFPPAPLNHRPSMSNSAYSGGAYRGESSGPYTTDRQSLSSASTTTFLPPNGPNGMTQAGYTQPPTTLTPLNRRVSDMSTPSMPSAPGGSGFENTPTVYQNEAQDYEYYRGASREYDRASYHSQTQPQPQRHASNEWSSPSISTNKNDPLDQYAQYSAPQYPSQGQAYAQPPPASARPQYQPPLGANDYAQVSQAQEYQHQQQYYQQHQNQQNSQNHQNHQSNQNQNHPYQGGGGQQRGYYR